LTSCLWFKVLPLNLAHVASIPLTVVIYDFDPSREVYGEFTMRVVVPGAEVEKDGEKELVECFQISKAFADVNDFINKRVEMKLRKGGTEAVLTEPLIPDYMRAYGAAVIEDATQKCPSLKDCLVKSHKISMNRFEDAPDMQTKKTVFRFGGLTLTNKYFSEDVYTKAGKTQWHVGFVPIPKPDGTFASSNVIMPEWLFHIDREEKQVIDRKKSAQSDTEADLIAELQRRMAGTSI